MSDEKKPTPEEIRAQIMALKASAFDGVEYIARLQDEANKVQASINAQRAQIETLTRQLSAETEKKK